ncbi:MAG: thiol:disulfide interchange protein DsbA/DsbL [Kangiellaceae bacterium]|nr:thiol:disulfide interchange protein DsbA/DsbL [Kangiellaceae bacterium]
MIKSLKIVLIFILASAFFSSAAQSEIRPLIEGTDYQTMGPKGTVKPEVIEFFSYACGHCYTMEGFVNKFKSDNDNIKFTAVPTDLGHPQWSIYVKAYYLGQLLKVLNKSHGKIFHRINVQKKPITSDAGLKSFFVELGVTPEQYDSANKSFALDAKLRKAKQLLRKYQINSTPTFVANQRYKLDNRELKSNEMIEKALLDLTGATN